LSLQGGAIGPTAPPPEPGRSTRASLLAPAPDLVQRDQDLEQQVERELPLLLARHLRGEGGGPEATHVILALLVGILLWGTLPAGTVVAWTGAITAAALLSFWSRRHLRASQASAPLTLTVRRWTALALNLAWGLGAARAASVIAPQNLALVLAVITMLLAMATVTLVADVVGFASSAAALLVPFWIAIAASGSGRFQGVALALLPAFAGALGFVYWRSHRALLDYFRTVKWLELSEQASHKERRLLDALLGGAPIAIAALDGEGRVLGVNGAFEQLFGFTAAELVGQELNSLIVPPEGRIEARDLEQRLRLGGRASADVVRRTRDGRPIPVRYSAAAVRDVADQAFFVMFDDLSALEDAERALGQAEEQYRELVESASDLVWQTDRLGRWTFLNAASTGVYGAEPKELLGHPFLERVDPTHRERDQAAFQQVLDGAELTDYETVHRDLAGNPKHLSFAARPVRDAHGQVVGARGTTRDVTERAAAREALERARELAERAALTKSAFVANVSHEIRTPMNGVLGMVELLLESELSPEQRRTAELARSSAEALLDLINDILDFSKIEAARVELEHISFDLPGLVASTVRVLGVRASLRQLEMVTDVRADVPQRVRGDPSRLRQILTNLIGNAVKFTERGEVLVSVTAEPPRDGVALARFAVRDSGIGIAPDQLSNIFQEFTQADPSHTRKYGGTGLGLSISKRLVELMGGDIGVTSELGHGSEFWFTVPLTVEPQREAGAAPAVRLQGARVLVVDDNASSRRVAREALSEAGSQVQEASTAEEALAALHRAGAASTPFDLAMIDAFMPEQDGYQLAQAIRLQPELAATRLIMLTSAGKRGDAQRCREMGIAGYLVKPVGAAELVEAAAAVLGSVSPDGLVTRHTIEENRRPLHILLAEDNPVNQEVAAAMLRKRGHSVDIAENGRQAVEAVGRNRYDMVLMDIQMPEMDGYEATRAIRAMRQGADLPIVACTAHAMAEERERCLAAGMTACLTKPFKPYDLFAAVEGWGTETPAVAAPAGPAPLDLDQFRRSMRDAGVEDAVDNMLRLFATDAPRRLETLTQAVQAGEAKPIEHAAHAFKSAAATITARPLAEALKAMELAARAGDVERARSLLPEARRATEAALAALR